MESKYIGLHEGSLVFFNIAACHLVETDCHLQHFVLNQSYLIISLIFISLFSYCICSSSFYSCYWNLWVVREQVQLLDVTILITHSFGVKVHHWLYEWEMPFALHKMDILKINPLTFLSSFLFATKSY